MVYMDDLNIMPFNESTQIDGLSGWGIFVPARHGKDLFSRGAYPLSYSAPFLVCNKHFIVSRKILAALHEVEFQTTQMI